MRTAWFLIAATGCATIDDGYALEIHARDAPVVVVKDGDGPWERIATSAEGLAFVQVHDTSYGVGALCGGDSIKTAQFLFDTQPRTVFLPCPSVIANPVPLHVQGTTEPMATVWVDGRSVVADETGAFDAQLFEPGLHDVVAILPTKPPKIVAHRAIAFTGDTRVDLPASGAMEMTAVYPRVTGASGDIEVSSDLSTDTDWISFGSDASTVYVPPSTFLLPTDSPTVAVRSGDCTRQHPLSAASEPFELPGPFDVTLDRTQIAWTADPEIPWSSAQGTIFSWGVEGSDYHAAVSASWREVTGSSSIPIVDLRSLPGWTDRLPAIEPDKPATMVFYLSRGARDGDFTSCSARQEVERW